MGVFEQFPYTNFHDLNLDWILKIVKEDNADVNALNVWRATHEQQYALLKDEVDGLIHNLVDVIIPWDPSIAYHVFSIVEYLGNNYIAIQDVPIGTNITDTNYWALANTVINQINAMSVVVSDLQDFKPYVTPEEYGAVGDGVTDDSLAISDCIADSLILQKPVVMTKTYKIDTLTINDDAVEIYCVGEIKSDTASFALTVSGQFSNIYINKLTVYNGSGMLITPDGKPAYMLNIKVDILRAKDYGIKIKDFVDPLDPNNKFGVLYNKITCKRIRVDSTSGNAIDFESDYFIGETNLDVELIDYAKWALHAVGSASDGINAIRTTLLAMEGDLDCIYLKNVHDSVFNGLRYSECVNTYGRQFLTMEGKSFANSFYSPSQLKLSKVDTSGITGTVLQYNTLEMPIMNDSGRMIAMGMRVNGYGTKFFGGFNSTASISSSASYDYYPSNFNGMQPTQIVVGKANDSTDYVRIHLDHNYAWDGINKLTLFLNGTNYRPVVLASDGSTLYDFRTLSGSSYNGLYQLTFNRSTDTLQQVMITKIEFIATLGSQPL